MKKQIIIIPAYKPEAAILSLVDGLKECFKNIVVVDDGGGAEYADIFSKLRDKGCHVLTHAVNMGKGRALKTACNYCLTIGCDDGAITVDGDGQHRIEDIVKVADAMESRPEDVVMGCRNFNTGNVPPKSYLGNNISRVVYKWLAGIDVSDTQTGLRGLPASFLPALCTCAGERYEYETNMFLLMKELGYGITEVTIETVYENNNSGSHFNPVTDSIKIYSVILKYSLSSLISSLIDYVIFAIAIAAGASILAGTYIARAVSCLFNFGINKKVVFKGHGNSVTQFMKYIVLVIISGTISGWAVTQLTGLLTGVYPVVIKIPVEVVLYFFNYTIQRAFIFKGEKNEVQ